LRKGYVDALHYLYSSVNITRMTISESAGYLSYVEIINMYKIWVTKLKAMVSNFLGTRDKSSEKVLKAAV
jgi:hypothetical protein